MTARKDIRPRDHGDQRVSEAFRSTQEALNTIPQLALRELVVTASGTAGAKLPLLILGKDDFVPEVALVVRVVPKSDATADSGAVSRANFVVETRSSTRYVQLYEPSGLTANESYTLTVQLMGGVDR